MAEFVDLSPEECAQLLAGRHFGRAAVRIEPRAITGRRVQPRA